MRKTCAKRARFGALHRSSPAHTTITISTPAARTHHTWIQPQRRPVLPVISRVYPQLLPHHYYHPNHQKQQQQQRAPTPASVGNTPATSQRSSSSSSAMGMTGSPTSTQAAPGSTQDGPSPQGANHTAPRDPGAPNPPGAAAGHAADLRESAGEHEEASAGRQGGAEALATGAAGVEGRGEGGGGGGGGGDGGGGSGDPKALPPPTEGGDVQTLEVDGKPISLDHMGPLVVHKDGTMSRISNWGEMTEIERQNTLRILVKRNQVRLGALREGLKTDKLK